MNSESNSITSAASEGSKVVLVEEDVKLLMDECDLSKESAEALLRKNGGNIRTAMQSLSLLNTTNQLIAMSGNLKVEFIDNSSFQYDVNAARIKLDSFGKQWGKLYLGDRHAASFVQLKHRDCSTVVNCCASVHMFAKEPNVKYLKIDPTDEKTNHLEEVSKFLDKELADGKNVVVHCEEGKGKSAGVIMYYVMKKSNISLAESYRFVESYRDVKLAPSMIKILITEEKKLRGLVTIALGEDRKVVFLDQSKASTPFKLAPTKSQPLVKKANPYLPLMILGGVGAFFGVVFGAIYMITGKI